MERYAEAVAAFLRNLEFEDIPPEVVEKAKLIFLDTLGNALAASTMDFGRMVLAVARALGGVPESRLIGTRERHGAANAVLANGTLAHGLDYDDTLEEAIVHTGCCGAVTALAVGERLGADGRSVLTAAVAGIEVMCKVGLVAPGKFHARGFHPTALCATFGAAAAAGKLSNLTIREWLDAFGICGSQSSGIIEYLADGTWTKRLHPGWSAHGGVIAVMLARQGFRGPGTVFEGRHGFYRSFAGEDGLQLEKLKELGMTWEIPRIAFKSYPCGSISHPYMDCALRLREKHGVRPDEVEEVVCRTAKGPVHRLWEPLSEKQAPSTPYGAKFSLPYGIAVILARGKAGLDEFSDKAIRDPEVLALAKKVRYELDPTIDYPRHFSGHVRVKLRSGTVLEENQPHPRGGLESPLAPEDLAEKFRANARMAVPGVKVEEIIAAVERLEQLAAISELTNLLSPE
ncbi:MAG: MmgE/PrpD family protein [Deltaproteobacteria bacterium]|nr:MmgE/PrpD family protein [Deltaproteobacteria bacterium]